VRASESSASIGFQKISQWRAGARDKEKRACFGGKTKKRKKQAPHGNSKDWPEPRLVTFCQKGRKS